MNSDRRSWILEHEKPNNEVRFWHKYPDHFKPAICGSPAIPGMPICCELPEGTVTGPSQVCAKCADILASRSVADHPLTKHLRELPRSESRCPDCADEFMVILFAGDDESFPCLMCPECWYEEGGGERT